MKKAASNIIRRGSSLIKSLGIAILALLVLVNIVGAASFAYIAYSDNDISVINTATNTITDTLEVGSIPFGVTVTPDEKKVYVTNSNDNTVSVIETATRTITTIKVGENPHGIAVNPEGTKVYVANYRSETLSVIDTTTDTVTATVNGLSFPEGVAVSPDGTKIYVTNNIAQDDNRVSVIDTATNTIIDTLNIGINPKGVAVSPDGTKIYVTDVVKNIVSVITFSTKGVATIDVGKWPCGVAVTPDGTKAYVANQDSNNVSVIDTATNKVVDTVHVGSRPCGVAITSNGTQVYVTNEQEGSVSVINTATNNVISTITGLDGARSFGQFIITHSFSTPSETIPTDNPISTEIHTSIETPTLDTITTLTSSADQYEFGQKLTLNAKVGVKTQETEKPSGTVTFMDGSNIIGIEDLIYGQANLTTSSLSAGSHSIIAKYSGDNTFKSSTSSSILLTVQDDNSNPSDYPDYTLIAAIIGAIATIIAAIIGKRSKSD